tara:strand:+ start:2141 stop:2395 length:255 start_codon:yes stop_codon:yes gene_type:complete
MNIFKKGIIVLTLILTHNVIQAQGIDFSKGNWKTIKEQAKEENKLIFVDAYTTWCGPCKIMDKNVFSDQKVGAFYNQELKDQSL